MGCSRSRTTTQSISKTESNTAATQAVVSAEPIFIGRTVSITPTPRDPDEGPSPFIDARCFFLPASETPESFTSQSESLTANPVDLVDEPLGELAGAESGDPSPTSPSIGFGKIGLVDDSKKTSKEMRNRFTELSISNRVELVWHVIRSVARSW